MLGVGEVGRWGVSTKVIFSRVRRTCEGENILGKEYVLGKRNSTCKVPEVRKKYKEEMGDKDRREKK